MPTLTVGYLRKILGLRSIDAGHGWPIFERD
jgi:hypothetical protein